MRYDWCVSRVVDIGYVYKYSCGNQVNKSDKLIRSVKSVRYIEAAR